MVVLSETWSVAEGGGARATAVIEAERDDAGLEFSCLARLGGIDGGGEGVLYGWLNSLRSMPDSSKDGWWGGLNGERKVGAYRSAEPPGE